MHRSTILSSSAGTASLILRMGGGFSLICLSATSTGEPPSKGSSPVNISYMTTPSE